MKIKILIFLFLFSLLIPAQENFWKSLNGPFEGVNVPLRQPVYQIAEDSKGVIYIITDSARVFYSTDNGENWKTTSRVGTIYNHSTSILISSNDNILVGMEEGLFISSNNGMNWIKVLDESIHSMSISSSGEIFAGAGGQVFSSLNNGISWNETGFKWEKTVYLTYLPIISLTTDSYGNLFAGSFDHYGGVGGIFRSTDNGENWNLKNRGLTNINIASLMIHNNGDIFAGTLGGGIFRSANNGDDWEKINIGLGNKNVNSLILNSEGDILAGTDKGIYISSDNGNNWSLLGDDLSNLAVLSLHEKNGNIFAGTANSGVFISGDNINWTKLNIYIKNSFISSIIVNENNIIYAGTFNKGIYRSYDEGENWTKINAGLTNLQIHSLFLNKNTNDIFAVTSDWKAFISTNNGSSWTQIANDFKVRDFDFDSQGNIYIGTASGHVPSVSTSGVYKSTNKGETWNYLGLNNDVFSLALNSMDQLYVYSDGLRIKSDEDSWVLINSSSRFDLLNFNSLDYIFSQGHSLNSPGVTINRSTDNGYTFESLELNHPSGSLTFAIGVNDHIYVGLRNSSGIIFSTDNGVSWAEANSGLKTLDIRSFAFSNDGHTYAGSFGEGIYRSFINFPVPVELTSFTAKNINNNIHLSWSTATETNNKGFEVYRKNREERNQNLEWKLLGFVEGKGTTTENQNYSFADNNILSGKYIYKLKQIDFDGNFKYSEEVEIEIIPNRYYLSQNYPNPFNPTTTIEYQIKNREKVMINIYNSIGEIVRILVNEEKESGTYEVVWDGKDNSGKQIASGIYYYKITAGEFFASRKMIFLK